MRPARATRKQWSSRSTATPLSCSVRPTRRVVGANFRFGHGATGTVDTLMQLGEQHGFTVEVFSLLTPEQGSDAVSSSLIRRQLSEGDVEHVAEELGRPFRLEGHVVKGAG